MIVFLFNTKVYKMKTIVQDYIEYLNFVVNQLRPMMTGSAMTNPNEFAKLSREYHNKAEIKAGEYLANNKNNFALKLKLMEQQAFIHTKLVAGFL